ncbi:amidohydrolase family protein [Namhaeicola litoreus]|uniref:Amidohydrolase family protein n=1 Tax=Namhaeicola litoreus TaxID=1052145 RepID=A0ABW3Y6N4_9FLAO
MIKKIIFFLFVFPAILSGQEYFPKNYGVKNENQNYTAFTNAVIHVNPNQKVEGTLLIRGDEIVNVSSSSNLPKNCVIIDLKGKSIYPSFIEAYSDFGFSVEKKGSGNFRSGGSPQYDSKREGYYWNDHILPERNGVSEFKFDQKKAEELRKLGFGIVHTHKPDGIIRGTGVLVSLNELGTDAQRILDDRSAQFLSFKKSDESNQIYPNSIMGSMALLKQVSFDADWYQKGGSETKDLSLEAYNRNKSLLQIFYAGDKADALRAIQLGKELQTNFVIVGGGNEYQLAEHFKKAGNSLIIPLNFPKAYDVENPMLADYIALSDMRYWNQAPTNLANLQKMGINFSLTSFGLEKTSDFKENLLKTISYGFDKKAALASLTTIPASILGKSQQMGTLEKGKLANFIISSDDIFEKETIIYENWIQGKRHVINDIDLLDLSGNYTLQINSQSYDLQIDGSNPDLKAKVKKDTINIPAKISFTDNWINLYFNSSKKESEYIRLTGKVIDPSKFSGVAVLSDGRETSFTSVKKNEKIDENTKKDGKETPWLTPVTFPNNGYGLTNKPAQETVLIKNATVWTNEKEGVLLNTDVLIKDGKIAKIGKALTANNVKEIDGTGKHLTSGIIDEHSHISTVSTNEVGQNSTAEVTMEEAINFEDINIYRALAGGVTQAQILHGSANPIGGRSAIIKMKWGETPDQLIDKRAPKFIKFALGENVKQSNWMGGRFPQSRMGVEQVFIDYFQRAKEYEILKKSGKPYRKDLELETLAEIINKERFISCHSYVQSEINMLMKVAEQFNFKINTFTHILEGYKVADKMAAHGVGGSTFSDWWAYKYEVKDAIPYNAALMHNEGVVTAINSDDAEMMRRLNQEAAKTVKYGGISEEEAWKMVTLNPARLLHIDSYVGSIKVGKDADLVLWTDNPLSVNALAERTMIEGRTYFDLNSDKMKRANIQKERSQLINAMLEAKNSGSETQKPKKNETKLNHCDTVD